MSHIAQTMRRWRWWCIRRSFHWQWRWWRLHWIVNCWRKRLWSSGCVAIPLVIQSQGAMLISWIISRIYPIHRRLIWITVRCRRRHIWFFHIIRRWIWESFIFILLIVGVRTFHFDRYSNSTITIFHGINNLANIVKLKRCCFGSCVCGNTMYRGLNTKCITVLVLQCRWL